MADLALGMIGNCTINALIDTEARIVWSCFPRFDGDPLFCRLVDDNGDRGMFEIELEDLERTEQSYLADTAVLVTCLFDRHGHGLEITDFAPRFERHGRMYRPTMLVRIVRPLGEAPRIRVRLRPMFDYGSVQPETTRGSHHIRYLGGAFTLRVTTDAPLTYVLDETPFYLDRPIHFMVGPDEHLTAPIEGTAHEFLENTTSYWRRLSGRLTIPFEWQEAVIRSAITLKLCTFEETGAVIAAPTTSLPEAHGEGRNWDYRYCWLRDSYFVVRALNRLGYIQTMEDYLVYLSNIVAHSPDGYLQPVFGIGLEHRILEREAEALRGYRGNRPVRIGNQAWEHDQHDGYGSVVLSAAQAFFDRRMRHPAALNAFERLERLGEKAWKFHDQPDAGLWEFRSKARVHTHSSAMCWAACDRLGRIARHLGREDRAASWGERAEKIRATILERAWSEARGHFVASFEGEDLDASLLLLHEVGFIEPDDARFVATVEAIGRELTQGPYVLRYKSEDDFGTPEHAFIVCTFWYIDALAAIGRKEAARKLFEQILGCRNHLGLMAEHASREDGELWGNFPQTYSHVGLIYCAMRLSRDWEEVV
ncbi:MAG TPA: glycoside hydrolase family 15 protein [Geminicoccaceae bacterium]|nr:glycoside hydrolase family 15 protein [Geminicoccaceae bacterium]